jgi:phosphonatase-like hydrolase
MSIKLAVFDMAGTTVRDNNDVAKAFQKAFLNKNISVPTEEINPLMGYHKPTAIKMVLEKKGVAVDDELIDDIHESFVNEMLDFYEYDPEVKAMEGAEDLFFFLKERGVLIALNTGFSKDIAAAIIARFQWMERGLVDDFIGSDEVMEGRPFPYMIAELKDRLGITEEDSIMKVGDTIVDIQEGKNAGCDYIISVTTGAASRKELEQWHPTHIVNSLSEIPAILNEAFSIYA